MEKVRRQVPVRNIDECIRFQDPKDEELLGFYFDKFNLHKRDVNPFIKVSNASNGDSS